MIPLLLMLVSGATAAAETAPWYIELPVAQVSLENPEGMLPHENLAPLLRTKQGNTLDLGLLRSDVQLLARAGDFASVEALVEPWVLVNEADVSIDAVRVVFMVKPAPRIYQIEVTGVSGQARKVVDAVLGLQRGAAFYPKAEAPRVEHRVRRALAGAGWPAGTGACTTAPRTGASAHV